MAGKGSSEFHPLQYNTLEGGLEMPGPVLAGVRTLKQKAENENKSEPNSALN